MHPVIFAQAIMVFVFPLENAEQMGGRAITEKVALAEHNAILLPPPQHQYRQHVGTAHYLFWATVITAGV